MKQREYWSSKLGVILAVAGSAIGLGNFLRFPVKAATYGGGAFLIPYLIAFVVLGIPLAWVEWTLGRYGGKHSYGSAPGILYVVTGKPWAKYLGSLGVIGPLLIYFYYIYIESWLLGFSWYALTGELMYAVHKNTISELFGNYITLKTTLSGCMPAALFFFILTFIINFGIIGFGIRRGIEQINKFALPLIFILGILLFVRVLTTPGINRGLGFM
jgi:SNF family Na+-dependent transporter